jgi:hypothetical protein
MIEQTLALKKAALWIQKNGYGDLRLQQRAALGLPDGWRVVYETLLAEPQPLASTTIRLRDSLLILFVDNRHPQAALETAGGVMCEFSQFDQEGEAGREAAVTFVKQTDQYLKEARLPSLAAAVEALRGWLKVGPKDVFEVLESEPVLDREAMQDGQLELARWRIVYRHNRRKNKCYVGYLLKQDAIQVGEFRAVASRAAHPPLPRSVRRYGRLDFDYRRQNFKLRVNLGINRLADSLTQDRERLLQMRGELMVWYCKHHLAAYLNRLGYQQIDLDKTRLVQLSDAAFASASVGMHTGGSVPFDITTEAVDEALQLLEQFSSVDLISAYPQMQFTYSPTAMISWAEDPSIVFHEFGHALGFLLYMPRISGRWWQNDLPLPVEEGFCDYLAAVLMEDLMPGFAAQVGIGGILTNATGRAIRCLPRFVGSVVPVEDDCDDEKYRLGIRWANLLWEVRQRLGGGAEADTIITCAHFHPILPPFSQEITIFEAHLHSLRETMSRFDRSFSAAEWDDLAARYLV